MTDRHGRRVVAHDEGVNVIHKFGATAVTAAGGEENVWDGLLFEATTNPANLHPASAAVVYLASGDAADAAAGTGLRTVTIEGVNATGVRTFEDVILDGVTGVVSTNSYKRIYRMKGATAGSGETNAGPIVVGQVGADVAITSATAANPGVFTLAGHGLVDGDRIRLKDITGGTWTTLEGNIYQVDQSDVNTFTLRALDEAVAGGAQLDTTGLGTLTAMDYQAVTTMAQIGVGNSDTMMAAYTVPLGQHLLLHQFQVSCDTLTTQRVWLNWRNSDGVKHRLEVNTRSNDASGWSPGIETPLLYAAETDIWFSVDIGANARFTVLFTGTLVRD